MSALASVQINQLRLRGDTRAKTALLASLDSQTWPGEDDPRIIFINRLHVKSPWWMLARELAQQSEVEYRTAVAVSPTAAASNTLVFSSEAHLVAQITLNLLRGEAPWYQQTWLAQMQLTSDPITVLLHRPVLVPEVLQQLQRQQNAATFFAHCTEADLHKLLTHLRDFLAISSRVLSSVPVHSSALNKAITSALFSARSSKPQLPQAQIQWAENWLPLLVTQSRSASAQQLALQLLACLGLWRFSPQQLRAPNAWSLWLDALLEKASAMNLPLVPVDSPYGIAPISVHSPAATLDLLAEPTIRSANVIDESPLASLPITLDVVRASDSGDEFIVQAYRYIQQAGFLYLINWLRDFDVIGSLPAPCSPWLWWAMFQRDCCDMWQVPLDESVQALLLEIGGLCAQDLLDSDTELFAPSLRAARDLVQCRMQNFHLTHVDWLAIPARVHIEQGYVQIYMDESDVSLDLRLAGLDLNPGWVPWLGRVLHFHFGRYPELQREVS